MDRRSLEYFRAVVDAGSITEAARRMSITQPAISKQVKALEARLDVRLFDRTAAGMVPTAAGHELYALGGDVLRRFERAEIVLRSRFSNEATFRIACPQTTAYVLVTPFMADYDPPVADLSIVDAPQVDALLEQQADLAISTLRPPAHRAQMLVAHLAVTAQGTASAIQLHRDVPGQLDLARLAAETVIVPRTGVHAIIDTALASVTRPPVVRTVATGYVAQAQAANGHGVALVTELPTFGLIAEQAYAAGRRVLCPLYASWDRQHYASQDVEQLARAFSCWMSATPPWSDV